MRKNSTRWWVVLSVVLVVYNVIAFAVPFPKNAVFFISWVFSLIAIGVQVYVVHTAFYQGEGVKSKFYGLPIAKVGVMYLVAQLLAGFVFMALGLAFPVPVWFPLVLYVVLLGVAAIGLIAADAFHGEVERQERELKKDVECMRNLQSKALSMVQLAQDEQARKILEKFAEDLRFSDPVSSEALKDIEARLVISVDELHRAVRNGDYASILQLEQVSSAILADRNRLCMLEKHSSK